MDFQELGLTLKQERERKGLSIEVVMEATKISRTNIVAMENGDRDALPHPVYTKGFVKSYARYLGLDDSEFSMVVDKEYQDEMDGPEEHIYEVSAAAEKAFHDTESSERKGRSKWPLLLLFVILAIVVVLLFLNLKGNDAVVTVNESAPQVEQVPEAVEPSPAVEEAGEEEQALPESEEGSEALAVEEQESSQEAVPSQEAAPEEQEQVAVVEQPEEPVPAVAPAPKPEEIESASTSDEAASKPDGQKYDHELVIRATTDKGCWIGLWKGDETQMYRDYVLKKGEPLRLKFNTLRRIRIGNVSGVTVLYNGQAYPLDSARGNIQTLRFGE